MSDKYKTIKLTAIIITATTIVCKILGFLKNSVLAYYFGTGPVVDAYVMSLSIGTITCGWIAGLIGNFTPVYHKILTDKGKEESLLFSKNIYNFILIIVSILVFVLELIAPTVVKLIAPGFDVVTYDYTVYFFRIYLISVLFYASFRFSQEFLNCNQKHVWATLPDVLMSSCCILAIIVSNKIGDSFLIFGYIIAIVLESILVHIGSYRIGFRNGLYFAWDDNLKSLLIMAIPIFLSNTLSEINTLVDKMFASGLESGVVASLEYAITLKDFAYQIGTIAMVTIIFPVISKQWAKRDLDGFKNNIIRGINMMTILYIPITLGIVLVGDLVISIVFKRGQFGEQAAMITTNAFVGYSLSLIAMAYRSVFLKAFYSMQKTKYILVVSSINVALNILLNIILVDQFGYLGLVIATCASSMMCLPLYFILFKRSVPNVNYKDFYIKILKASLASFVMYIVVKLLRGSIYCNALNIWHEFGVFTLIVMIGVLVYVVMCVALDISEIKSIIRTVIVKVKIRKRN